jgi:GNAT superfamily N-acetyltransferase
MQIVEVRRKRSDLVRRILADLPQWFGIPESREQYARDAETLPMLAVQIDGRAVGFLSIKRHSAFAAEAYVLGIERASHRNGLGRALFASAEQGLRGEGVRFLTVKTLSADHPDPHYRATRLFYEAIGFVPLEVFPTLWGAGTPCLQMVKSLDEERHGLGG